MAEGRRMMTYVTYASDFDRESRVGHLDFTTSTIQPLSFLAGTPVQNLYQVIEAGNENIVAYGQPIALHDVKILPPATERDVLAVESSYVEHTKEFNDSGYSSNSSDSPNHANYPVIFTKRATSIIAVGQDIVFDSDFTQSLGYGGKIGVIIGKTGFKIPMDRAMDYVWGYTIINDVTAGERQRAHGQFCIGKSGDTYCPMGPVAVPIGDMPSVLEIKTIVNGEERQKGTTDELDFNVPYLIKTLSEGQTLYPGDILATGMRASAGLRAEPRACLSVGDVVEISVTNLGTLRNKIVSPQSTAKNRWMIPRHPSIPVANSTMSLYGNVLTDIGGKRLWYQHFGRADGPPIIFIHGLGGTSDFFMPLISRLSLGDSNSLHMFDLEGHGLSPTSALSKLSIEGFASDVAHIFAHADVTPASMATVVAHSMGCFPAILFAMQNPGMVQRLILFGPPPSPMPEALCKALLTRASAVRNGSMVAVGDAVANAGTSNMTKLKNPVALAAVRLSLLGQDPEGYAKGCMALADAKDQLPIHRLDCHTLIISGEEDRVSPPNICLEMSSAIPHCEHPVILKDVGHWHVFEDPEGVATAVEAFLQKPSLGAFN